MTKLELVERLRAVSGWSRKDQEALCSLRYWVALKNAAQDLGEEDFEKAASAEFPAEMDHFCWALAQFVEANVEAYTTPKSTLTGTEGIS